MIAPKKRIFFKIHDPQGNDIDEHWDDAVFEQFTKKINSGYGECIVRLARTFDSFGEGDDVRLNNIVDIYVNDIDTDSGSEGKIIYSGYISGYRPFIKDGNQGVIVHLLGHHTKLSQDIYKNGSTTTISESGTDIGTMVRNIMARYEAETTSPQILINNGNIDTTSTTGSYDFKAVTYLEAIEICRQLAPAGWFWYIDTNRLFHFKNKSSDIDHHFYFGRHFEHIETYKNMENIINEVLLFNGDSASPEYHNYSKNASQGTYGRRVLKYTDRNFEDTNAMQRYADYYLDNFSDPEIVVQLTLMDNNEEDGEFGYDIESVEVGDTVKIEGFENTIFQERMVITEYRYLIDRLELTIQPLKTDIFTKIFKTEKELEIEKAQDIPSAYT